MFPTARQQYWPPTPKPGTGPQPVSGVGSSLSLGRPLPGSVATVTPVFAVEPLSPSPSPLTAGINLTFWCRNSGHRALAPQRENHPARGEAAGTSSPPLANSPIWVGSLLLTLSQPRFPPPVAFSSPPCGSGRGHFPLLDITSNTSCLHAGEFSHFSIPGTLSYLLPARHPGCGGSVLSEDAL